ncbi:MAG: hypothetical protein WBA97_13770 [Actinophytocola sp.]|uniref:hypothetical protein n=1 Tax=Actinophytocola sp. TaxID=1872138 RepID=UPI003C733E20
MRGLKTGLPAWPQIHEELIENYTTLEDALVDVDQQSVEADEDHDTWFGWTRRALAALHAGEPGRVLDVVAAARTRLGDDVPRTLRRTEAYALARTGHPDQALTLALADVKNLPMMSRFDQAEMLHLLGDLAEHRGRLGQAIRYLLNERTVNPPVQAGRLHNRLHLMNLLLTSETPAHRAMAATVASEGLAMARQLDTDPTPFADALLRLALNSSISGNLDEVLSVVGADGSASLTTLAIGADAVSRGEGQKAVAALTPLLKGKSTIAAHAALLLGSGPLTGPERTAVLRLGSEIVDGRRYRFLCTWLLFDAYWADGQHEALVEVARDHLDNELPRVAGAARMALGAVALTRGEHDDAVRWYGEAVVLAGLEVLEEPLGRNVLARYPEQLYQVGAENNELLRARITAEAAGRKPEGVAARVGLVEAIDAWAEMFYSGSLAGELVDLIEDAVKRQRTPEAADAVATRLEALRSDMRRRSVDAPYDDTAAEAAKFLTWVSERLWDHEKLEAALAARGHACRLHHELDDHASLALELGWMGAIARQAGRPGEAEAIYQRAIAIGATALPPSEQAFVIGRYGNLLHQQGDFAAAVHQQWRAVCVLSGTFRPLTVESLAELDDVPRAADPTDAVDEHQQCRWALLLVNLANCLLAIHSPLFPSTIDLAETAYAAAHRLHTKQDNNMRTIDGLLNQLRALRQRLT